MSIGPSELLLIVVIAAVLFGVDSLDQIIESVRGARKEVEHLKRKISDLPTEQFDEDDDADHYGRKMAEIQQLLNERLLVFVASDMEADQGERAVVRASIEALIATRAWLFEDRSPATCPPRDLYSTAIAKADLVLIIVGESPTGPLVDEYMLARKAGKPILVYVRRMQDAELSARSQFLSLISRDGLTWAHYQGPADLAPRVSAGVLNHIIARYKEYGLTDGHRSVLLAALTFLEQQEPSTDIMRKALHEVIVRRHQGPQKSISTQSGGATDSVGGPTLQGPEAAIAQVLRAGGGGGGNDDKAMENLLRRLGSMKADIASGDKQATLRLWDELLMHFETAGDTPPMLMGFMYISRARARLDVGDAHGALSDLESAEWIEPGDSSIAPSLGNLTLLDFEKTKIEALSGAGYVRKALNLSSECGRRPDATATTIFSWWELAMKESEHREARAAASTYLDRWPERCQGHRMLARALLKMSRHRDAEAAVRRAIRIDPNDSQNQQLLGMVLTEIGDAQGARKAFAAGDRLAKVKSIG